MSSRLRALLGSLVVLVDVVMTALAFYLAYLLRSRIAFPSPLVLGPFSGFMPQLVIQVFSMIATLFIFRLYHLQRTNSRIDQFYSIVSAVSIASLISTALSFFYQRSDSAIARGMILYTWGLSVPLLLFGRALTGWVKNRARRARPDRMLLIGTGDVARMIQQKTLQNPSLGYKVVGFVATNGSGPRPTDVAGVPVLGTPDDLPRILREQRIQDVVITLPEASHDELVDLISVCESEHAAVRIFPDLFQIIASELRISDLDGLPLLTVRDVALRGWNLTIKRAMDLVGSGIGLILLSPMLMFVALLIKLESKGPVFYAQTRVGLDSKPFPVLKFRSMRVDAEAHSGPVWATEDDPRRTRLGTFLRKSSIDELPQLINVLLGEMSLVGPRPERPIFVEQFRQVVPRYMERHKEKAGLTGWAQVNGLRGDTSIVERTKYDLYYIENWSLLFDIKILIRTVINQFRGDRNAY
jgi:exopolysaccharide biosynthesis polyprenyl glycosylphosphotransferase